jgi:hypothetical protein
MNGVVTGEGDPRFLVLQYEGGTLAGDRARHTDKARTGEPGSYPEKLRAARQ